MTRRKNVGPQFWAVADHFRGRASDWAPANAGYELRRVVDVDGDRWTVCFKVHVVGESNTGKTELKSSVTLWPPAADEPQSRVNGGWQKSSARILRKHGYRGGWSESADGPFGDFWKSLSDVADVRRESRSLEKLVSEWASARSDAGGVGPREAPRRRGGRRTR